MANLPVGFINEGTALRRISEGAIGFNGDTNLAASCSAGIGINTGNFNPKVADWRRIPRVPFIASQHMGGSGYGGGDRLTWPIKGMLPDGTLTGLVFVQAEQETPPLGVLDPSVTGAINRTNQTVPAGAWAFGTIDESDTALAPGARITGGAENRVSADGDFRVVV